MSIQYIKATFIASITLILTIWSNGNNFTRAQNLLQSTDINQLTLNSSLSFKSWSCRQSIRQSIMMQISLSTQMILAGADEWRMYGVGVESRYPAYAERLNSLKELEFGQAYWIHTTETVIGYLEVEEGGARVMETSQFPPATYFGHVLGEGKDTKWE